MAKQVDAVYGNALFETAIEDGKLDTLYEEALVLVDVLNENDDLIKILKHPHVDKEDKIKIVEDTFAGRASDEITGLLTMLVDKGHSNDIVKVFNYFIKLVKDEKNIGVASVTSAVELSDSQKEAIEARLIETTRYETVEVEYKVDSSIIGGLIIRIEDRVVDSSIKSKLETMSKTLAKI